ncbi:MAG: type IV secretion system DNA-binding domain-containing protein [Sandaracinaceae bacterium]|nr:type IV secretion system DNA-binding domain-containing protein [Sandaracinaceae bacterium]
MNDQSQPAVLGFATINHRLHKGRRFGIKPPDLLRHMLVLGKTGTGKSTLLETLFVAQMDAGHGAGLLDPHGDLAERVIARAPRSRRNDLVVFDPARLDNKILLNLVEPVAPELRALAAANALSVLRKTFADGWGPRTEHLLRNALLTLLETPRATLMGALRLFIDDRYRAMSLRHVTDPVVRYFWEEEFPSYSPSLRAEALAAPQNKLGALLANPFIRKVVDTPRKGLDVRNLMDARRLFVANLAKGKIGEDGCAFLGAILLARFQLAAYGRADRSADSRAPFTLYVDEFPSFATPSFAELLAEARKYGLGLVLANQHLAQLDDRLRAALLGNAGTLAAFRLSAEDALAIEPEFAPELRAEDLARLGQHEIALKLSVDGVTSAAFTASSLPVAPYSPPQNVRGLT